MRCGENGDVGTHHHAVSDGDEAAVEDGEVEVGVETDADADIGAVVDVAGEDRKLGGAVCLPCLVSESLTREAR